MNRRTLSKLAIWGWPVVVGAVTTVGLIAALFSDGGFGDGLAAVCLGLPVAVGLWFGWLSRGHHSTEPPSH
jgi:hypothetical protein